MARKLQVNMHFFLFYGADAVEIEFTKKICKEKNHHNKTKPKIYRVYLKPDSLCLYPLVK